MKSVVYYNGLITDYESARIPLSDRSVFFGDAIYEVMLARNNSLYQYDEHFSRLKRCCDLVKITCFDFEFILTQIKKLLSLLNCKECTVYIQVSRNLPFRQHSYESINKSNLLVIASEYKTESSSSPISTITLEDKRYGYCHLKTVNLLPAVIASQDAFLHRCQEAIFCLPSGIVTECAHSNIFMVKDGVLKTHPEGCHILSGITRMNTISIANKLNIPIIEEQFTVADLLEADEIFVTSTTHFARRVICIDGKQLKTQNNRIFDDISRSLIKDYIQKTQVL